MRQFVIAILAFIAPFAFVWLSQRMRQVDAPRVDARIWFLGCVLAAATFAIAALLDSGSRSGGYVETIDAQGRPVSVFKENVE